MYSGEHDKGEGQEEGHGVKVKAKVVTNPASWRRGRLIARDAHIRYDGVQ